MDKLNIIHSFYSKNCSEENLYIHSCYFILSCLYVNQIGGNINIHTDDKFASLIESCPYKNIYVDMNDCYNAPSDFFAYPKLLALKKEPLGTIHIDGDVFLKDSVILDLLKFNDYDCITQNLELRKFINDTLVWDKSSLYFHNIISPVDYQAINLPGYFSPIQVFFLTPQLALRNWESKNDRCSSGRTYCISHGT